MADDAWEELSRFRLLDREGRLLRWPTKAPQRQLALRYLVGRFATNRTYTEAEVNEVIKNWHAFGDWALLRRELVDRGFLKRDDAGRTYRVVERLDSENGPRLTRSE